MDDVVLTQDSMLEDVAAETTPTPKKRGPKPGATRKAKKANGHVAPVIAVDAEPDLRSVRSQIEYVRFSPVYDQTPPRMLVLSVSQAETLEAETASLRRYNGWTVGDYVQHEYGLDTYVVPDEQLNPNPPADFPVLVI